MSLKTVVYKMYNNLGDRRRLSGDLVCGTVRYSVAVVRELVDSVCRQKDSSHLLTPMREQRASHLPRNSGRMLERWDLPNGAI